MRVILALFTGFCWGVLIYGTDNAMLEKCRKEYNVYNCEIVAIPKQGEK